MPTTTFPITSAADDGSGYREAASWAGIASGTFTDFSNDAANLMYVSKNGFDATKYCDNTYLRFDTSALPDNAVITAANLLIYQTNSGDADNRSLVGDFYDFGGEPAVAADWLETSSPAILTADITTLGSGGIGVKTIPLTNLAGINRAGYTGIRLTISGGAPVGNNFIELVSYEHANQEPRLEVTYTDPGTSPWMHEQTVGATGDAPLAYTNPVKTGSLLIAMLEDESGSLHGLPTDSRGNVWTEINSLYFNQRVTWWYAISKDAGACTVTFPASAAGFEAVKVSEWSVPSGTISLDVEDAIHRSTTTSGTDAFLSPSVAASADESLVLGYLATVNGDATTITAGTNYAMLNKTALDSSGNDTFALESRILSTAGSVTAAFTAAGTNTLANVGVAVFKVTSTVVSDQKSSAFRSIIMGEPSLTNFLEFNDASGNFTDSKGSWVGTAGPEILRQQPPLVYDAPGNDYAIKFDNSYPTTISFGDVFDIANNVSFTIEFTIQNLDFSDGWNSFLFGKGFLGGGANTGGWWCDIWNHTDAVTRDGNGLRFRRWANATGAGGPELYAGNALRPNEKYHIVITLNSSTDTIDAWVNGYHASTNSGAMATTANAEPFIIGAVFNSTSGGAAQGFEGLMDTFAVYNNYMPEDRVIEHYKAFLNPNKRVPVVHQQRDFIVDDHMRSAGFAGDRRAPEGSYGMWYERLNYIEAPGGAQSNAQANTNGWAAQGSTLTREQSVDPTGSELLTNTGIETDTSGWTTFIDAGTIARSTAQAHTGSASLAITATGAHTYIGCDRTNTFALTPGEKYQVRWWVRVPTAGTYAPRVAHSAGTWEYFAPDVVLAANTWTEVVVNMNEGAGVWTSGTTELVFQLNRASGTYSGEVVYFDDFSVKAGVSLAAFGTTSFKVDTNGSATGEGMLTNPRITFPASGQGVFSCWVKAPVAATLELVFEEFTAGGAVVDTGTTNFTGTGDWQNVEVKNVFGATGDSARLWVRTRSTTQNINFYVGGCQLEETGTAVGSGDRAWSSPYMGHYVSAGGGRGAQRLLIEDSDLPVNYYLQGWVAYRWRHGFNADAFEGENQGFFQRGSATERISVYSAGYQRWITYIGSAGGVGDNLADFIMPAPFAKGTKYTGLGGWTTVGSQAYGAVDGANLVTASPIPSPNVKAAIAGLDVADTYGSYQWFGMRPDSEVFWSIMGSGVCTNADSAALAALPDTPTTTQVRSALSRASAPFLLYNSGDLFAEVIQPQSTFYVRRMRVQR